MNRPDVIHYLRQLSPAELAEVLQDLQLSWKIDINALFAGIGSGAVVAVDDRYSSQVYLESFGDHKISVIRAVRIVLPWMSLKEAKDLVEAAPILIPSTQLSSTWFRLDAERFAGDLREAGAKVRVVPSA